VMFGKSKSIYRIISTIIFVICLPDYDCGANYPINASSKASS